MKARLKLVPKQKTTLSTRRLLIYSTSAIALAGVLTWLTFIFLNVGNNENAYAAGSSFTSNRSGTWTTGSTWNGGTAPSTSPNGDNITISTGHNVTANGALSPQNNTTFTINGTLTINSNLEVKNNLILNITGSLIVNGNIEIKNGASVTINGGGTLSASGNLAFGNNANVTVNGSMSVGGNLSFGSSATFNGSGNVSVTGTSCSQWAGPGGCSDNTTLPIELISFDAKSTKDGVVLNWKTASELNNDHFTIERSQDGINYESIAEVNGSGTTDEITDYEFTDTDPLSGTSYYRLSQTDFDGKSETFKPVPVQITASGNSDITVYPNPIVGNTLHVKFSKSEKGIIELIDSRGYNILSESVDGFSNEIELSINSDIKPGIYYLNFKSGGSKETVKLMK